MKLYGLIGFPLGHSFSKKYFEEKFADERIEAAFELFPLKDISEFVPLIKAQKNLSGLAVTIPHKQAVMPFLTRIEDEAKEIGAVNCIKISGETTTGYNTDAKGFERSFIPLLQPHHKKALVLGTGGASKAVQYVLKKNNIAFLSVSRTPKGEKNCISYEDIDADMLWEYPVLINCTPVGMIPNEENQPALPYHFLTKENFLYDLIYKPQKTKFLEQGEKRGCIIKNGFEMLMIQAEENWRIWNA